MDPISMIIVPGLLGGLVIALVVFVRQRRASPGRDLADLVITEG